MGDLTGYGLDEGLNMVRCPFGGGASIFVVAEYTERGDTAVESTRWTIAPDRCEIKAVGDTLILEGDPEVVFEREFRYLGFLQDARADMTGAGTVTWRKDDGSSGTCEMDMAMENADVDSSTGEIDGSLAGRLCGFKTSVHFSELS